MTASEYKSHPDYSTGYFDAVDGLTQPASEGAPYMAGWEAGGRAKSLLSRHGFAQSGRTFSKRLEALPDLQDPS